MKVLLVSYTLFLISPAKVILIIENTFTFKKKNLNDLQIVVKCVKTE